MLIWPVAVMTTSPPAPPLPPPKRLPDAAKMPLSAFNEERPAGAAPLMLMDCAPTVTLPAFPELELDELICPPSTNARAPSICTLIAPPAAEPELLELIVELSTV